MAKRGISTSISVLTQEDLEQYAPNLAIPSANSIRFPTGKQTILNPPDGYIGIYLHAITEGNLRFPLSSFYLNVLEYFKCHLSLIHPLGTAKIMSFEVMCRAYGSEPSVDMFRQFFQTGAAGDWVTIAKRPGPSCFLKEGLDIRNWKECFFFINKSMVPPQYPSVVDKSFATVPKQFRDARPSTISDPLLFRRLTEYPISFRTFPEPILFLAGVAPLWEGGTEEPVILLDGREMAFRNFVNKSSGKEISFMIKNPPLTPRDVGSPTRSEQGEASSKTLVEVKKEKVAEANQDVVDVEQYQMQEKEQVTIARRTSSRKGVSKNLGKRKFPPPKGPSTKKGKAFAEGKASKEDTEVSEEDNLPTETCYGIFSGTPEPSYCHRVMATCAPKGWLKGLDRLPVTELADLQSQSSLQLAIIDNVLNTKAREAAGDLIRSQEEVETLNSKVRAQEEDMKVASSKLTELEKCMEESVKVNEEVQRLRKTSQEQALEIAKLQGEESRRKALEEKIEKLRAHVSEVEREKGEVITKVIPHVCKSLMDSDEAGVLLADCINSARAWERAIVLEELAASGQTVVLSEREDYNVEASHLFDSASEALANAKFPYVQEVSSKSDASVEDLLSITPHKVSTA